MPSIEIMKEIAKRGNPDYQFQLGIRYYKGQDAAKDWQQAATWLEQAAKEKTEAFFLLYDMYSKGAHGLEKNTLKALSFLHELADQDCQIFKNSERTPKARHIARANYLLFQIYEAGEIVPRDRSEALEHLAKAIKYGSTPAAKFSMAEINEADPAAQYAAASGYKQVLSDLSHDILHYLEEHFLPPHHFFVKRPYKDYSLYAKAAFNLGRMYEEGRGVVQDRTLALNHYHFAAELGHPQAGAKYEALKGPDKGWGWLSFLRRGGPVLTETPEAT